MASKNALGPDRVDVKTLTIRQFRHQRDTAADLLKAFVHQAYKDHEI